MTWFPHVTVATIIHRNGEYLIVKEHTESGIGYNQPAGHLEANETLIEAAERETLEETGWQVKVTELVGISRFIAPANGETYIRFTFIADALSFDDKRSLDDGIIAAEWLTKNDLETIDEKHHQTGQQPSLRSPLVLRDIERFESGERLPLSVLYDHTNHS